MVEQCAMSAGTWVMLSAALVAVLTARSALSQEEPPLRCRDSRCTYVGVYDTVVKLRSLRGHLYEIGGQQVAFSLSSSKFAILCDGSNELQTSALPRAEPARGVSAVDLSRCQLPRNVSIVDMLETIGMALQCKAKDPPCQLEISLDPGLMLHADILRGLKRLDDLTVNVYDTPDSSVTNVAILDRSFFAPLQNLRVLMLHRVVWAPGELDRLPASLRSLAVIYPEYVTEEEHRLLMSPTIEILYVKYWKEKLPAPLTRCDGLRGLYLRHLTATALPPRWLAGCLRLEVLRVEYARYLFSLPANLLVGLTALWNLTIKETPLWTLPADLLHYSPQLLSLDLAFNQHSSFPRDIFIKSQQVRFLRLDGNYLDLNDCLRKMEPLEELTHFYLMNNKEYSSAMYSCEVDGYSPLRRARNMSELHLPNSGITRICRDWIEDMPVLRLLDLRNSSVSELLFEDLTRYKRTVSSAVDLTGTILSVAELTSEDYMAARALTAPVTLRVGALRVVRCSCGGYWTRRAMELRRPLLQHLDKLRCADGSQLRDLRPEDMWCARPAECGAAALPAACACDARPAGDPPADYLLVRARCERGNLTRVPAPRPAPRRSARCYRLGLAHNNITDLRAGDLRHPELLEDLDLSFNPLREVDEQALAKLSDMNITLRLAGNEVECSCHTVAPLREFLSRSPTLVNLVDATCVDRRGLNAAIAEMDCSFEAVFIWISVGLSAALALGAAGVACCWSRERRFFARAVLHHWGWRGREPEGDGRRFDVFLCFVHQDKARALEVIARLEPHYRLCVHVRDWEPGELILSEIEWSVNDSRRTLALVSRHFLASPWARAEFRAAHAASLVDGRPRLLLALLEEPAALQDAELRAYIASRTYLRWGERAFWKKLELVLPPPRTTGADPAATLDNDLQCELLDLPSYPT